MKFFILSLFLSSSTLSSFGREPTPGQTQTGLGPKVYPFTHPKPSDLVLRVVLDIWVTLLKRGLRFVQRVCDPIGAWAKWNHPTSILGRLS